MLSPDAAGDARRIDHADRATEMRPLLRDRLDDRVVARQAMHVRNETRRPRRSGRLIASALGDSHAARDDRMSFFDVARRRQARPARALQRVRPQVLRARRAPDRARAASSHRAAQRRGRACRASSTRPRRRSTCKRVADRLARDAEPQRDLFLGETLPRRQCSVRDRVHEAIVHLIDQRARRGHRVRRSCWNSEFRIQPSQVEPDNSITD